MGSAVDLAARWGAQARRNGAPWSVTRAGTSEHGTFEQVVVPTVGAAPRWTL
jgi:hypothetical protein